MGGPRLCPPGGPSGVSGAQAPGSTVPRIFNGIGRQAAPSSRLQEGQNRCMEPRSFRMDQLSDLATVLKPGDHLVKADIKDAYYHLRLQAEDQLRLEFLVDGDASVPLCLK
jgi:hypothetical protein